MDFLMLQLCCLFLLNFQFCQTGWSNSHKWSDPHVTCPAQKNKIYYFPVLWTLWALNYIGCSSRNIVLFLVTRNCSTWLKIKGGVEDTTLEAKDTKKFEAMAKHRFPEDRPFRGQGQELSRPRPRTKDKILQVISTKKVFTQKFCKISEKFRTFSKIKKQKRSLWITTRSLACSKT